MCHSVDMYMPEASRRAAEERIRAANIAGAERERRVEQAVFGLVARLRRWLGRTPVEGTTQEQAQHG